MSRLMVLRAFKIFGHFPASVRKTNKYTLRGHYFSKTNLSAASIYRHKSGFLSTSILKYFHFRILVSFILARDVQLAVIAAKTTSAE